MDGREIKSPEVLTAPAASLNDHSVSEAPRRKRLSNYFIESDDRRTALGGGYVGGGGTTPVTIRGKPISNLSRTGGWIAAFFIFGTTFASFPVYPVLYGKTNYIDILFLTMARE